MRATDDGCLARKCLRWRNQARRLEEDEWAFQATTYPQAIMLWHDLASGRHREGSRMAILHAHHLLFKLKTDEL